MVATEPITGARYAEPGDLPAAYPHTGNMVTDLRGRVTGYAADESARTTLYAAMIAAGLFGMRCYVHSRRGTSFYDGGWRWETAERDIFATQTSGPAGGASTHGTEVGIFDSGAITLVGGSRFIRVTAHCTMTPSPATPLSGDAGARLYVTQDGVELRRSQRLLKPHASSAALSGMMRETCEIYWEGAVAAGAHTWRLNMLKEQAPGSGVIDLLDPYIRVTDVRPV